MILSDRQRVREREQIKAVPRGRHSAGWITQMSSQLCISRAQGRTQTDVLFIFLHFFLYLPSKTVQKRKDRWIKTGKRDTGSNIKANFGKNSKQVYTCRKTLNVAIVK